MDRSKYAPAVLTLLLVSSICAQAALAQSSSLQQKVQQAKALLVANRQQLSRYTWQMQETVSVRGEVKSQLVYQVQLDSAGKPLRTEVSESPQSGPQRQHGVRHRVEQRYKQYAQQVGALAQSYAQLSPSRLQELYAQGQVSLKGAGTPGYVELAIKGYEKPGDSIVLTIRTNPQALISYYVSSYLSDPSDSVTMMVRFDKLADGTRYASSVTVNATSKELSITDHSYGFELRGQ
jgi:hypothetical protein